ncbi:MAG TPA: hypothetical protein VFT39_04380 [Vicinamibacterales bacterium]|nr:hypothetical protein [Vicinamibacterales bacterium]
MAKKPKKKAPTKVSVNALHREISKVKNKLKGARTDKAKRLKKKLVTFAASIDCGQTLLIDIGS